MRPSSHCVYKVHDCIYDCLENIYVSLLIRFVCADNIYAAADTICGHLVLVYIIECAIISRKAGEAIVYREEEEEEIVVCNHHMLLVHI